LIDRVGNKKEEQEELTALATNELIEMDEERSWVDSLAHLVISVPPAPAKVDNSVARHGTQNFRQMIIDTLKRWASESEIESNELIRKMFKLLLRQYTGVKELMDAMSQTYVLHERNIADVEIFIVYLIQIRELLHVEFESYEEAILKRGLWQLMVKIRILYLIIFV
jgi:ryanodine receptor 2